MKLQPVHIEARDIPDAWFQIVYKCLEVGRDFKIDQGSNEGQKRLEFDYITVHITYPNSRPLLPNLPSHYNIPNPVADDYLDSYMPYLMTGELKKNESYTYGSRLYKQPLAKNVYSIGFFKNIHLSELTKEKFLKEQISFIIKEESEITYGTNITDKIYNYFVNQVETIIWTYKNKGYRNNQMIMQIGQPDDCLLKDPPCLRTIDTRIQDGKLHFIIYFRSWDLWGGFPANLAAIQQLKEYMASEIGVEDGEMIASSKGLHLYNYVWELAELIRGKTIEEFRCGK